MSDSESVFKPSALDQADRRLVDLYEKTGVPLDVLAYSNEFEEIHTKLTSAGDRRTKQELFRRLLTIRKSGRLPRLRSA